MVAPIDHELTQLEEAMAAARFPLPEPTDPLPADIIEWALRDHGLGAPYELVALLSWVSGRENIPWPGDTCVLSLETALKLHNLNRGPSDPPMLPTQWFPVFTDGTYTNLWADTSVETHEPVILERWAFDEPTPPGTFQVPLIRVVNVMTELLKRRFWVPDLDTPPGWHMVYDQLNGPSMNEYLYHWCYE